MKRMVILLLIVFFMSGCGEKKVESYIDETTHTSINYPITNIMELDNAISSYVNKNYSKFKYINKGEFNISYTYNEVNSDIVNVSLVTKIVTDNEINKIKTFTYNKKTEKFLTMENIVDDLTALDYDVKKNLLEKYKEVDVDYLNNLSYDYFSIDDDNLTLYFNLSEIKGKTGIICLDIPLDSLNLLIDWQKEERNDSYISIKKKNVNVDDKVIALTFDDGPSQYTNKILDILKKYDACGTFFVIGNHVQFYSDELRRMLKEGSEIGNHSFDHKLLTRLSEDEFKEEINKTNESIKKVTGFTPTLFRPTYGGYNNRLKGYTDLKFVLWDIDSRDWKVKSKERILNNILPYVKPGNIVLMHDNHVYSVNVLEDLIKNLKNNGYKFVTVSELLEIKKIKESEWTIMI